MQTTTRTRRDAFLGRRRQAAVAGPAARHAGLSPVWEIQPRGHNEIGALNGVLLREKRLRRSLAAADVLGAASALLIVIGFLDGGRTHLAIGSLALVPFVLLASKVIGLYDRDTHVLRKSTLDEMPSILYLSIVFALGTWLGEVVFLRGWLERPQVFALLVFTFVLTALGRLVVRTATRSLTASERCVVVGSSADARRVATKFAMANSVNATVVGRVSLHADAEPVGAETLIPKLGNWDALARVVSTEDVERVIIAPQSDNQDEILDAIRMIKALGVRVSVLPRLLEVVGSASTFDDIDGMWLLGVRQFGLGRSSEMIKRATDVAVAGGALLLFGPLFVMLTLAVKLDSPGPIFFRQSRIGRRGETFWMLKFRSMVVDAEALKAELQALNEAEGGMFKIAEDPRITRSGRLLRKTSLDELPQLLNVLRGDMSLVGPRPLIPDEDSLITGWQRRRLSVKPGMTGLWQIFGSSRIPMNEMVKIDYIYGANWSLWLDLRILLRTVPYMLSRRGM